MTLEPEDRKIIIEELKKELQETKKVIVEKCREDIILPNYANIGDAGMDIRAAVDVTINPLETKVIPTGLKMVIPNHYELQVRPRSGLSLNTPLRVANTPGTVDSGYRDEIGVIITNISPAGDNTYTINEKDNKKGSYIIKKGDRIAQIVLCKYETIEFIEVEKDIVKTIGVNRGGGFGHSGTK